MMAKSWRV